MRGVTKNTINSYIYRKDKFKERNIIFKSKKEFQIWLGRELIKLGFEVYLDRNICEIPSFKGDREKPDLLVFFKKNFKINNIILENPIAIETKARGKNNKFSNLSKSILQIKKYYNKEYNTNNWCGKIKNVFLCTDDMILKNKIYSWDVAGNFYDDKSFHEGLGWGLLRVLFNISNISF